MPPGCVPCPDFSISSRAVETTRERIDSVSFGHIDNKRLKSISSGRDGNSDDGSFPRIAISAKKSSILLLLLFVIWVLPVRQLDTRAPEVPSSAPNSRSFQPLNALSSSARAYNQLVFSLSPPA